MTKPELKAFRGLLRFSIPESCRLVAASEERPRGVSERAWRMWEAGELAVPQDVSATISRLLEWREKAIAAAEEVIAAAPEDTRIALVWYNTPGDWLSLAGREELFYRPQQSALAAVAAYYRGRTRLVPFDRQEYREWLGAQEDTETRRSAWAALKIS